MFDEEKSEAFRTLKNLCSDLIIDKESIGKEVSCSGTCFRKGKAMTFFVEANPDEMEESLELWLKLFSNLDGYIEKAKDKISPDFLPTYWEDDDPEMTEEEFKKRLSLESLSAFHGHVVTLDFSDDGMFGGHTLGATSVDEGKTFAEVEMLG